MTVLLQIAAGDLYFQDRNGKTIADLEIALVEKTGAGPTNVRQQPLEVTLNESPADLKVGTTTGSAKDQRAAIVSSATTWPLNPATDAVRVSVRDRSTGRYGTLEMPLNR